MSKTINEDNINEFKLSIDGSILRKDSKEYKESLLNRWNLDVKNSPLLIVFPVNVNDVVKAINFSRECKLDFAVKSGGHGTTSACVDGLLIDFCKMKAIRINSSDGTVVAESGCLIGELDLETSKYKSHVPLGHVSHTGIAGLTLGGGISNISRSFGLTVDNLIQVTMVDYNGQILKVDDQSYSDLFYGIKGAGSNFGVVTEFKFKLNQCDNIFMGRFVYQLNCGETRDALIKLGEIESDPQLPNQLSVQLFINSDHVIIIAMYNGSEECGKEYIDRISSIGKPIQSTIKNVRYLDIQKSLDDKVPPRNKYYQRGPFLKYYLNGEIVDILLNSINTHPTSTGVLLLIHLGGAISNSEFKDKSSYPYRDAKYQLIIFSNIPSDDQKQLIYQWTIETHSKLSKYCYGDYSNTTDSSQHPSTIYGHCFNNLQFLKSKYDNNNFFHNNINIKPLNQINQTNQINQINQINQTNRTNQTNQTNQKIIDKLK